MTILARAARRLHRRVTASSPDEGFTVIEVVVAIALVTIVMTAMASFFVNSAKATENQSQRQSAVQVAQDGVEQARALTGIGLTTGRDKATSDALWAQGKDTSATSKFPGVAPYLSNVAEAYDTSNPVAVAGQPAGYSAALATNGNTVTLNGIAYTQNWFLGTCYSAQGTNSGQCSATAPVVATTATKYVQVVVAVTWTANSCSSSTNRTCSYITATRISPTPDPLFDANQSAPKPRIVNPGNQTNTVGQVVILNLTVSGGTAPLTWTATGLPAGLTLYPGLLTTISGTPTTATTTPAQVVVSVTDVFGFVSTAAFTWTITNPVNLANPGTQTFAKGSPVTLTLVSTGGTLPYSYALPIGSTLPAGLALTPAGVITGTPTTVSVLLGTTVSVKVTDSSGSTDTELFTIKIITPLTISGATAETSDVGLADRKTITAAGGTGGYTYTLSGQPAGMTIAASTGVISGTPTATCSCAATVTVTDSGGNTATATFAWRVYAALTITAPTQSTRADARGTAQTITSAATGGDTTSYTWSASGLPTGMSIDAGTGKITGTPSQGTRYLTTITVTDGVGDSDSFTFEWKVNGGVVISLGASDNQIARSGTAISAIDASASGATYSNFYWTVDGLPPGLSFNSTTGKITGTPNTPGTYTVTLTAQSYQFYFLGYYYGATGTAGNYMFTWTVS